MLAVFFAALFLVLHFYFNPFVRQKLVNAVSEGSGGLYALEIGKVYCNPLTGYARFQQVRLRTDTVLLRKLRQEQPGKTVAQIDLRVEDLYIRRARVFSSFSTKDINLGRVTAFNPELRLQTFRDSALQMPPATNPTGRSFLERLPGLLSKHANSVHLQHLSFLNARIFHEANQEGETSRQQADSIDLVLENIYVSEKKPGGEGRALYTDDVSLHFKNYTFSTSTTPYAFAVGAGEVSSGGQSAMFSSISAGPVISDDEFTGRQKWRRPRFRLDAKAMQVKGLDFFQALHHGVWMVQTVELQGGTLDILIDKRVEHVPNKKMPHEILRSVGFPLTVDSVLVKNLDIVFNETKESGKGVLHFSNTYSKVLNLTNDSLRMTDSTPARIYASCQLMGKGPLDLAVRLPLHTQGFFCSYQVTIGSIPMMEFNPLFEKDNLEFDDGTLKSLRMDVRVSNGLGTGTLEAVYSDLKITLRKPENDKKRGVASLFANILIRNDNKSASQSASSRTGDIRYERMPGDDFMRFLWRTARCGLLDILVPGVNVPLPPD